MKKQPVGLIVILLGILIGSGLLTYIVLDRTATSARKSAADRSSSTATQPASTASPEALASDENRGKHSIINELFGLDGSQGSANVEAERGLIAARVLLRFLIAAFLAMLLAFRWRRGLSLTRRNPYVAQTQILLAVVAAAMMMIVGDSAARAFGIFAAASLVRFRTNIRDPKETTVLLICLGVGLACGVGRLDMALILTLFVLFALWILEYFESSQIFRAMEIRIETRNLDQTHQVLKKLFARHDCSFELRQLERGLGEGENGKVVYELSLGSAATTDQLSEEILAEDSENIACLEWEQKKSSTYIYN